MRDKNSIRKLAFAKLTVEVWHRRFLWSNLLVGSVDIKLKDLLAKCSISLLKVGLKNSEKNLAVEINGEIKIRSPLSSKEIRVVNFDYISLIIPEINSNLNANQTSNSQSVPNYTIFQVSSINKSSDLNNDNNNNTINLLCSDIDHNYLSNPLSIDLIYGNDMLEHEKIELTERIIQCKSRSRTDPEATKELFELQSRISKISMKLSVLVYFNF